MARSSRKPSLLDVVPTEHAEQVRLMQMVDHASAKHPRLAYLFAIPNGGHRRKGVAGKLRAEGVKPGVPDLMLPVARMDFYGLFVEMKRRGGGQTSAAQARWHRILRAQGYCVMVCEGWESAWATICWYLDIDPDDPFRDRNGRLMSGALANAPPRPLAAPPRPRNPETIPEVRGGGPIAPRGD